ncbi:unnamed protein product [Enterobius vermicularis]|uniref:Calcyclin-binding protein n=1 Tax=Enterobius vermicularis TaxID=51028 RepID=A0A0N4V2E8_ENTVE|nr:unnamed protein product [Enterobius vermicularis]
MAMDSAAEVSQFVWYPPKQLALSNLLKWTADNFCIDLSNPFLTNSYKASLFKAEQRILETSPFLFTAFSLGHPVRRNLHELQSLRSIASRPYVQNLLDKEIDGCQKRLEELQSTSVESPLNGTATSSDTPSKPFMPSGPLPTVKITNYAWDQSDKFVKLYLTIPGIHTVPANQIVVNFASNRFDMTATNVDGKNYELVMKGLMQQIDPGASYFKQKTDSLLIMLKKKEGGKWEHLVKAETSTKDKSNFKFDEKADPQESLMKMMKQMYDEGDDDMKRTIRKAWHESQTNKAKNPDLDV